MSIRLKFVFRRGWLSLELGRRSKNACGFTLAVSMLLAFTASCLASETRAASQQLVTGSLSIPGGALTDVDGRAGLEVVKVEPEGWAPEGFRYRVVVGSTKRGATSSCELTAEEGGLLVIARDVDGIGNDLDLIIKSARSLIPVGVWINDHRGGFRKADAKVYAQSIFSEVPLLISDTPPTSIQPAGLPSHPSCIYPPTRRSPFSYEADEKLVHSTNIAFPPRLSAGPHQTRAPPLLHLAKQS